MVRARVKWNDEVVDRVAVGMRKFKGYVEPHRGSIGIHEADGAQAKINDFGDPEDETLAQVMAQHEFGLGVPERSFLRSYFDQNAEKWKQQAAFAMRAEAVTFMAKAFGAYIVVPRLNSSAAQIERQTDPMKAWFRGVLRGWRSFIISGRGFVNLSIRRVAEKEFMGFKYPDRPLQATQQFYKSWTAMLDGEFLDPTVRWRSGREQSRQPFSSDKRTWYANVRKRS